MNNNNNNNNNEISVTIHGFIPSADEYYAIKERGIEVGAHRVVASLSEDGKEIVLECHFKQKGFERIRRITGYLVGTLDKWNDAKKAEEHERVKHCSCESCGDLSDEN